MTDHVDRFHAALLVLAGHGHVKQRLIRAFEEHLDDVHSDELPAALRQSFADLYDDVHRVAPLNGEGPICASVRKMSLDEASACAARIVTLYGELARQAEATRPLIPLGNDGETPVPPFLVKSV